MSNPTTWNKDDLIYEIDQYVYDLMLNGVSEHDVFEAMREYVSIQQDLTNVAPL